jgi:hypothetical protein
MACRTAAHAILRHSAALVLNRRIEFARLAAEPESAVAQDTKGRVVSVLQSEIMEWRRSFENVREVGRALSSAIKEIGKDSLQM